MKTKMKKTIKKRTIKKRNAPPVVKKLTNEDLLIFNSEDLEAIDFSLDELIGNVKLIQKKEPEFYKVVFELLKHLSHTYQDKYENTKNFIDTKKLLYDVEKGKYLSIYQSLRYLQRFLADGKEFKKGENKTDMLKAIHYILFHCVMMNRKESTKELDIKE